MAAPTTDVVAYAYGTQDIKVAPVTADTVGTYTVGTYVDVPGARTLTITGEMDVKSLRGDESELEHFAKLTNVTVAFSWAKYSFQVDAILTGKVLDQTGTGANEVTTATITKSTTPGYFAVQARTATDKNGGCLVITADKVSINSLPEFALAQEDFADGYSTEAGAVATIHGGDDAPIVSVAYYATAPSLPLTDGS